MTGSTVADVAVIGGGFVGLWTALEIKRVLPGSNVVVLERDVCGGGASGRNGGFVMSWWPKIASLLSFCNVEDAVFLAQSSERAIDEIRAFCETHAIDAHFRQSGWLWTATTEAQLDSWRETVEACANVGAQPFTTLTAREVARRTGSSVHRAGVFERSNATVQPAALVKGMRGVALAAGIRIFENTKVRDFSRGRPSTISADGGEVRAAAVVLATNAWAAAIPELSRLIVPVNSSIIVTEPIPERLEQIGWTGGESITDSQLMVNYYRTTRDGRIAFGKGSGAIEYGASIGKRFSYDEESRELTCRDFLRTFPMLKDVRIAHAWAGPIDRTYDSLPVFGTLDGTQNIHYGIGWSGNGVGPSRIGGKILASLALGKKDEWSTCPLVGRATRTFPPEPFRFIGGSLVRRAVLRKEQRENLGLRPRAVDVALARFAPAGLEDKS
ncbi:FAD-dependent oxidoreductase [Paraburkholderia sp. J10-1]|uniref:NAD(P)/FAD-dependent oxidoreductase n=1 Tax=Paraburkholderia sp. J10-1 TaxID=2805430 RepID=UPI002AB6853A|nr:FAD-dependent oxidoreductase [Paraburkholderia sp. J10-1]